MPFDKLDKKAREAAKNYNPAYDEAAWDKMEAMLNEHMPVQEERQEVAKKKYHEKWLFLLLGLVAGLFLMLLLLPQKNENNATSGISENKSLPGVHPDKTVPAESPERHTGSDLNSNGKSASKNSQPSISSQDLIAGKRDLAKNDPEKKFRRSLKVNFENNNADEDIFNSGVAHKEQPVSSQQLPAQAQLIHHQITAPGLENFKIITNDISLTDLPKPNKTLPTNKVKTPRQSKNKFENSFSLNFSAGPDVSAISLDNIGSLKILLGAGISYNIGKRLQLRTGVYTVKKVYDAKPSDYHPEANFWLYYPQLEHINADCRIIEIPLIVNYILNQNDNHAWFASVGASSYFMKRETYYYISKISPGQYQEKAYTMRNENMHYFSSVRLSAGYERKLNNKISFSTEPYLNLPLSGVGYGKVKLSSAGVLFTINVRPFSNKK